MGGCVGVADLPEHGTAWRAQPHLSFPPPLHLSPLLLHNSVWVRNIQHASPWRPAGGKDPRKIWTILNFNWWKGKKCNGFISILMTNEVLLSRGYIKVNTRCCACAAVALLKESNSAFGLKKIEEAYLLLWHYFLIFSFCYWKQLRLLSVIVLLIYKHNSLTAFDFHFKSEVSLVCTFRLKEQFIPKYETNLKIPTDYFPCLKSQHRLSDKKFGMNFK